MDDFVIAKKIYPAQQNMHLLKKYIVSEVSWPNKFYIVKLPLKFRTSLSADIFANGIDRPLGTTDN